MALRLSLFVIISFLLMAVIFLQHPIPQDITYHYLADTRVIFSIPNFMDVVSNIFFVIAGAAGLYRLLTVDRFHAPIEKQMWGAFFTAAILIGFGAMYYHLAPTNNSLIWERLPMVVAFTAVFSAVFAEKISAQIVRFLGPLLIAVGILSVVYWDHTEARGMGDLRPYLAIQYVSLALLPLILGLFRGAYSHRRLVLGGLSCYILAKICEYYDHQIYSATRELIAGHTIKHLLSALGILVGARYINVRHPRS